MELVRGNVGKKEMSLLARALTKCKKSEALKCQRFFSDGFGFFCRIV